VKAFSLEQVSIGISAGGDGSVGVMEQIEVAGDSCAGDQFVEGSIARNIALTSVGPIASYEATEFALESCESHRRRREARTWASWSPFFWMQLSTRSCSAGVSG
jgi:hypothetical protein